MVGVEPDLDDPPSEKGEWGTHFSRLANLINERGLEVLKCSSVECGDIWPDEDCTFFDLQYRRWQTCPLDLEGAALEEPEYDWEIVEGGDILCSDSTPLESPETSTPEPLEVQIGPNTANPQAKASNSYSYSYKSALLRHQEREAVEAKQQP